MSTLAAVVAEARMLLDGGIGDATNPDLLSDEQLMALAGGPIAYGEYERWVLNNELPTTVEGLALVEDAITREFELPGPDTARHAHDTDTIDAAD